MTNYPASVEIRLDDFCSAVRKRRYCPKCGSKIAFVSGPAGFDAKTGEALLRFIPACTNKHQPVKGFFHTLSLFWDWLDEPMFLFTKEQLEQIRDEEIRDVLFAGVDFQSERL